MSWSEKHMQDKLRGEGVVPPCKKGMCCFEGRDF